MKKKSKKKVTKSKRAKKAMRTSKRNKAKKQPVKLSGPTLVAFLLDETGSMSSCKQATISGFNEYVTTLKNSKNKISFTLTKFNSSKKEVVYDCVDIKDVKDLDDTNYVPNHNTPLYDAIGNTIRATENNKDSKGKKTLVVIQTDGEENDSREFNQQSISDLIKEKEKTGWTFVFLGANIDAYAAAKVIGIKASNTANYSTTKTDKVFRGMAMATQNYACNAQVGVSAECFYASAGVDVKSFVDDEKTIKAKDKQVTLL
jgi:hypothetical protein